ncbi:hypothetical protein ZIOFF_020203 [Zingiber officinale]|uniref:Mitochondrial protein n=1 Tax=Zingiber officinale TaxID=94328 RepID=A0A8J5H8H6_ZINOF|nr:hypothetical protein ZIOFF_020203 [Zingiber officinale]
MAYYLGIELNQREDGSFISQAGYAREILKKFRMDNSKSINTPVECGVKLSKHDEEEKSLHGRSTTIHLKIAKRILRYIKASSASVKLVVLGRQSSQRSWHGHAWIWLCLSGSVLFFAGGLTNAVRVIAMQRMERVTIDKLRGSA